MEHKTVNLDGVNVHYVEAGEGPHLVLVHGLGASHVTWYENIQPLADAGFHVLAPDLPGHGDSDKPKSINYDPPAGANLLDSFLKAIDVRRAALVGNSAGGLVSALYALDHPHRVDRLILVAAGGMGPRNDLVPAVMLPTRTRRNRIPALAPEYGATQPEDAVSPSPRLC